MIQPTHLSEGSRTGKVTPHTTLASHPDIIKETELESQAATRWKTFIKATSLDTQQAELETQQTTCVKRHLSGLTKSFARQHHRNSFN